MINISLWLYGKPSWGMPIEGKAYINPKIIRESGDDLRNHLHNVADILEKLQSSGWKMSESYGSIYALELHKNTTKKEAQKELKTLKINIDDINIEELEDEE